MRGALLDVFRLRQYFNVATRAREFAGDLVDDLGFVNVARRALAPLPVDRWPAEHRDPFPPFDPAPLAELAGRRVALLATGGSGALASVVGAGRALEECGVVPAVVSLCSGSALFGFPLAAGIPASEVADFTLSLRPDDYVDVDWPTLGGGVGSVGRVRLAGRYAPGSRREHTDVLLVHPVPYGKVQGPGFYRQFLDTTDWPAFMHAGWRSCADALQAEEKRRVVHRPSSRPYRTTIARATPPTP